MRSTVSVKLGDTNPPQKFDTTIDVNIGDRVIVETPSGSDWGVIASTPAPAKGRENNMVLRIADTADNKTIDKLVTSAAYALKCAAEELKNSNWT